jgi:hypothetical protein
MSEAVTHLERRSRSQVIPGKGKRMTSLGNTRMPVDAAGLTIFGHSVALIPGEVDEDGRYIAPNP